MNYSIVTPTKNEGKYIRETINSMISQEIQPVEWFIMDDDSTDNTGEIVKSYLDDYSFIKYIKLSKFRTDLVNTGGRVAAIINYANTLRKMPSDIIGKVDADVSFEKDFFTKIIQEFKDDDLLGIASGHLVENGIPEIVTGPEGCRGATLIIRNTCFLQIGGFYVSKTRGEDALATVAARSKGWKTNTFDIYFNHLKPEGVRKSHLQNHYITGYYKGSIPAWLPFYLVTLLRDVMRKPYVIGAIVQLYAYVLSRYIVRYRPFPKFVCDYYREEQKRTLLKKIKNNNN